MTMEDLRAQIVNRKQNAHERYWNYYKSTKFNEQVHPLGEQHKGSYIAYSDVLDLIDGKASTK